MLGIPTFEDKVAQRAVTMVLEAIYEQDFLPCSYGFRPHWFARQVVRIWRKWLSRRHRRGAVPWARLNEILARHPLPPARILHGFAAASEPLS